MRRFCCLLLALGSAVSCGPSNVPAEQRAHSIEAQVWSPYCPGRLLIDCTTTQARQLRNEIANRVERGDTNEEVLRWVRDEYGEGAVARPGATGRGLAIWLVPVAFFVVGGIAVARVLRRWAADERAHVT